MFNRFKTQRVLVLGWFLLLLLTLAVFQMALSSKSAILDQLDSLEQSIITEQWEKAYIDVQQVRNLWEKRKYIHYLANEMENLRLFEKKLVQFELLIKYKEDHSLETLGEVRETIKDFLKVF